MQTCSFVGSSPSTESAEVPEVRRLAADERMMTAIMDAISDDSSSKILGSIISRGRSVEEICSETGISLSTVYRRIHEMAEYGLVFLERVVLTKEDKRYAVYRSAFSRVTVQLAPGDFLVTGTPSDSLPSTAHRLLEFAMNQSDSHGASVESKTGFRTSMSWRIEAAGPWAILPLHWQGGIILSSGKQTPVDCPFCKQAG